MLPAEVARWVTTQKVVFDPELGWRPEHGFVRVDPTEFIKPSRTALATPRRTGELRGFAFGDSQTRGAGIPENRAWPSMAEHTLQERGLPVRVLNMGSIGYRSAQVLRLVESYVLPMKPDFLVVDCMVNDSVRIPRDTPAESAWMRGLLFESRIYRLLWLGVATLQGQNTGPMGTARLAQPTTPDQQNGPGNHPELMAVAHEAGVPIFFVDYPFLSNPIHAKAPAEALPSGAIVVPATAALNASASPPEQLFLENNHLSMLGSEIVGNAVAEVVVQQLGLGSASP